MVIKVLLIEDNPGDVAFIRLMLERHGPPSSLAPVFQVFHVETVDEAVEFLASHHTDIALVDLGLGPTTGLETFMSLYKRVPDLPVVVFTGLEDEELGLRTINEGAQDYLVKGQVDANLLIRTIRYAMQRKRSENELSKYKDHLEELVEQRTAELERSYRQLEQAERLASIGALAAGIAHEINNPIATIILAAQNALEINQESERSQLLEKFGKKVLNHANRCAQIVKGVLQFSKRQSTEKWPTGLNMVVKSAIAFVRESTPDLTIPITVDLASELPEVLLNPLEIEQVIINLVKNALEAADSDSRIKVSTRVEGSRVVLVVEDSGKGMTEDEKRHVFDPFFTTRQQEGGTGLGLSIVHGIVSGHNGKIEVESTPGEGTRVEVSLPAAALTISESADKLVEH